MNETLFVSIKKAKQPEDLARAARTPKSESGRLDTAGTGGIQIEHALCVRVGW
ncbi:hypothetical protein [Bacillus sp. es.036]|uniref:hypothetical protein n=1 Tax=Bacillus sp. es.036 TaxID=1761764 RepID=UPI0015CF41D3|nr:hypothetical protein [Bacillus sp. es.036]